jgi:hypothetical protein
MTDVPDVRLVPNPLSTYLSPLVPERTAELMAETDAISDHQLVRRAAAGAATNQWEVFASLLSALYEYPERAIGVARAAICDLVECALVGARGNGDLASLYFDELLNAQFEKGRRRG